MKAKAKVACVSAFLFLCLSCSGSGDTVEHGRDLVESSIPVLSWAQGGPTRVGDERVRKLEFDSSGQFLLVLFKHLAKVIDVRNMQEMVNVEGKYFSGAMAPDGGCIALGHWRNPGAKIVRLSDGATIFDSYTPEYGRGVNVDFSRDGKLLAITTTRDIVLLSLETLKPINSWEGDGSPVKYLVDSTLLIVEQIGPMSPSAMSTIAPRTARRPFWSAQRDLVVNDVDIASDGTVALSCFLPGDTGGIVIISARGKQRRLLLEESPVATVRWMSRKVIVYRTVGTHVLCVRDVDRDITLARFDVGEGTTMDYCRATGTLVSEEGKGQIRLGRLGFEAEDQAR